MNLPRPSSTVIYRDLPEGAILFCTRTEVYFSLNPIGAQVWRLLPPVSGSVDEIVANLSAQFPEVDRDQIAEDVHSLIAEFEGNGLLEISRAA